VIPDYRSIFDALHQNRVDFVVIGAVAMVLHGSARVTRVLDICYARDRVTLDRLAKALQPFEPALRGAPQRLPFVLDTPTLQAGLNFTLRLTVGDLDLLGEVTGIGGYRAVERLSVIIPVYEYELRVLGLDGLERAKRAAGRLKDLLDLAEIRAIRRLGGGE
jgi:hypothetical protein